MARYDDTFVDRFLEPWNRHDARRQRQLIGGSLHLSSWRHGDERLQQREASDHDASLAQLNLFTKSIACRSATRT